MKKNMGKTDKGIRVILAIGVALLYFFNVIEGTLAYILMAFAIIFLLTSFVSFCPLYAPFGISTCKTKKS
jgi:predicted PurR-regulated permease PerM